MGKQIDRDGRLLGELDAWENREKDYLTKEGGFVEVEQYTKILQKERCFLCGRRGSGKSAIAIVAESRRGTALTRTIEGEAEYAEYLDVVRHLAARFSKDGFVDITHVVSLLWQYALRITVLQSLVINRDEFSHELSDHVELIELFLDQHDCVNVHLGYLLVRELDQADKLYLRDQPINYAGLIKHLSALLIDKELKLALECAARLLQEKPLLLVIDTLESYEIFGEGMTLGLRGVVNGIRRILRAQQFREVDIRFFMPAEIFEYVSAAIPQKTVSRTVFIEWKFRELLLMLTLRHLRVLENEGVLSGNDATRLEGLVRDISTKPSAAKKMRDIYWYERGYLPATVTNAAEKTEDTFAYMLRHTQRRPRELILIFNSILSVAHRNERLSAVEEDDVKHGLHRPETLRALVSEAIGPHRGYLDQVVDRARACYYGEPRFMIGRDVKRLAKGLYGISPVDQVDENGFVAVLLRSGVIGLVADAGHRNTDSPYIEADFEYLLGGHLPLADNLSYCVHPAFGDLLDMRGPTSGLCVYPRPIDDEERGLHAPVTPIT